MFIALKQGNGSSLVCMMVVKLTLDLNLRGYRKLNLSISEHLTYCKHLDFCDVLVGENHLLMSL